MSRLLIVVATLALSPMLSNPAPAQIRGGGTGSGGFPAMMNCPPGNITCYATQDAVCRESGGFMRLSMTMASAVALECTSDRARLDQVFRQERAQTETCTSGHLCIRHGTRTGNETNIYRLMVGMMNTCLRSHGRLEVYGILADDENTSTAYAGCLPRR